MERRMRSVACGVAVLAIAAAACSSTAKTTERPRPKSLIGASTACGTESGKGCAPVARRIDLERPVFSNPTKITNPLFPVTAVTSYVQLGTVGGKPFRAEVTVLPDTKTIEWEGRRIETVVSQYTAYVGGRLEEVALDWYAQADDGSVWYFGEDVFNYAGGRLADTEGTWITGKDGPAAMIMPAAPKVGDVYRPENSVGVVFEEVTVTKIGEIVQGPQGSVSGAILVRELHMDGAKEDKTFAPGYGEFFTGGGGDRESMAVAVPRDAVGGSLPAEVTALSAGALGVFSDAGAGDWQAAQGRLSQMRRAWSAYDSAEIPPMLRTQIRAAFGILEKAIGARSPDAARAASLDTAYAALDLELRYRPPAEIDHDRFGIWARRLQVDASRRSAGDIAGDVVTLGWIRDRFAHTLPPVTAEALRVALDDAKSAADAKDFTAASRAAQRLISALG